MSASNNAALVREFYRRMSALDFDGMFALMADDAIWTVAGNPQTFHHAGVATKSQRQEVFGNFTRFFTTLEMEVRSTTAEDDRVAAELITRCATHHGLQYSNELLVLIRCRDGQIASIYEHLDQQTALDFDRRLAVASEHGQA